MNTSVVSDEAQELQIGVAQVEQQESGDLRVSVALMWVGGSSEGWHPPLSSSVSLGQCLCFSEPARPPLRGAG